MENKLQLKSDKCPYCKSEMQFGYISAAYPIFWHENIGMIKSLKGDHQRLSGIMSSLDRIPSFKCSNCGIVIGQFE